MHFSRQFLFLRTKQGFKNSEYLIKVLNNKAHSKFYKKGNKKRKNILVKGHFQDWKVLKEIISEMELGLKNQIPKICKLLIQRGVEMRIIKVNK